MCEYKTLEELKKALDNKELPSDAKLMIDNDTVYMYTNDFEHKLFQFDGDPTFDLLPDALRLLGFKAEPV